MISGRITTAESVTEYTLLRIVPDADGEIVSIVVEDVSGVWVWHFERETLTGSLVNRQFLFQSAGGERYAWIRVNCLLETAIHAVVPISPVREDAEDPRHMGMGSGPLPFEF